MQSFCAARSKPHIWLDRQKSTVLYLPRTIFDFTQSHAQAILGHWLPLKRCKDEEMRDSVKRTNKKLVRGDEVYSYFWCTAPIHLITLRQYSWLIRRFCTCAKYENTASRLFDCLTLSIKLKKNPLLACKTASWDLSSKKTWKYRYVTRFVLKDSLTNSKISFDCFTSSSSLKSHGHMNVRVRQDEQAEFNNFAERCVRATVLYYSFEFDLRLIRFEVLHRICSLLLFAQWHYSNSRQ
jgi:hypothetical protein